MDGNSPGLCVRRRHRSLSPGAAVLSDDDGYGSDKFHRISSVDVPYSPQTAAAAISDIESLYGSECSLQHEPTPTSTPTPTPTPTESGLPTAYVFVEQDWSPQQRRLIVRAQHYADVASAQYAHLRRRMRHYETHKTRQQDQQLLASIDKGDTGEELCAAGMPRTPTDRVRWCEGCKSMFCTTLEFHTHDAKRLSVCQLATLRQCLGPLPDSLLTQ